MIGGGPAGMQAAITAKKQGHKVTLLEKTHELGGQLNIASVPPKKYPIKRATDWFVGELKRQGVNIQLNHPATVESVEKLNPDVIIAATGSVPATPPIDGVDNTIDSWGLLDGSVAMPKNSKIVIVGGGVVACEVALYLNKEGNNTVTVIEMLGQIANGLETTHLGDLFVDFEECNIGVITNARVTKINSSSIAYEEAGELKTIDCDVSVLATGQKPFGGDLIASLKDKGYKVILAGDVTKPRKIMQAVREGNFAGFNL